MELADTSAWSKSRHAPDAIRDAFDQQLAAGEIATCGMVMLELLYTARSPAEFHQLQADLQSLHQCPITREVWDRAFEVFGLLADSHQLRSVKPADLLAVVLLEQIMDSRSSTAALGVVALPVPLVTTLTVDYIGGAVLVAGDQSGTVAIDTDDAIQADVDRPDGTSASYYHDFSNGCSGADFAIDPFIGWVGSLVWALTNPRPMVLSAPTVQVVTAPAAPQSTAVDVSQSDHTRVARRAVGLHPTKVLVGV